MVALLQNYSLSDILMFTIFLALAVKSLISFFDWAYDHIKRAFYRQHGRLTEKEKLEQRLQEGDKVMAALKANQQIGGRQLRELAKKIDLLIESDKDDIKSYITKEHHYFCYQQGWIDDFSLDCLEKRYQHYLNENGNSFIKGFMEELRALPKQTQIFKK